MKITIKILTGIIILLSIGAGLAKVMQVPQEVEFLGGIGLSTVMIIVFGAFQILGGILTVIRRFKIYGLSIIALGFIVSSLLIFYSGDTSFGMISLIPIVLAVSLFYSITNYASHDSIREEN